MEWMLMPLKRYADFSGRSRRKEYWMFLLFEILLFAGMFLIAGIFGAALRSDEWATSTGASIFGGIFGLVFLIAILGLMIPRLAVTVRRLHDTDHSGWFMFISLVPLIGPIVLLVFLCTEGTRGENRYGDDPKLTNNLGDVFS